MYANHAVSRILPKNQGSVQNIVQIKLEKNRIKVATAANRTTTVQFYCSFESETKEARRHRTIQAKLPHHPLRKLVIIVMIQHALACSFTGKR